MKKIIFLLTIVLAGVIAHAQTRVAPGSTRTFTVNQTNSKDVVLNATTPFSWNATGTAITNAAAVIATHTNSVSVQFSATTGNTGSLTVFATSDANCSSETKTMNLVVQNLIYTYTLAQPSQDICPQGNGATGVPVAIAVNFAGGNVTSFVYSIDGVAQPAVAVSPAAATANISITTPFTNDQHGAHVVKITSITGASGTDLQADNSAIHTINVSEAPAINDIF